MARMPTPFEETSILVDETWGMERKQREIVQAGNSSRYSKSHVKEHQDPNIKQGPQEGEANTPEEHPWLDNHAFYGDEDQNAAPPLNTEARTEYDNQLRLQNQLNKKKTQENTPDFNPKPGFL